MTFADFVMGALLFVVCATAGFFVATVIYVEIVMHQERKKAEERKQRMQ